MANHLPFVLQEIAVETKHMPSFLRCIIHTILFHRTVTLTTPVEEYLPDLDVSYVCLSNRSTQPAVLPTALWLQRTRLHQPCIDRNTAAVCLHHQQLRCEDAEIVQLVESKVSAFRADQANRAVVVTINERTQSGSWFARETLSAFELWTIQYRFASTPTSAAERGMFWACAHDTELHCTGCSTLGGRWSVVDMTCSTTTEESNRELGRNLRKLMTSIIKIVNSNNTKFKPIPILENNQNPFPAKVLCIRRLHQYCCSFQLYCTSVALAANPNPNPNQCTTCANTTLLPCH
jgi:hypothetical protein